MLGHLPYNTYKPARDRGFSRSATQHPADRHGQYNGLGGGQQPPYGDRQIYRSQQIPALHRTLNGIHYMGRHFIKKKQYQLIAHSRLSEPGPNIGLWSRQIHFSVAPFSSLQVRKVSYRTEVRYSFILSRLA